MEAERKRDGGCGWRELGLDLEDLAGMTSAGLAVMSANIFMETFRQIITAIGISASIPVFYICVHITYEACEAIVLHDLETPRV